MPLLDFSNAFTPSGAVAHMLRSSSIEDTIFCCRLAELPAVVTQIPAK